MIISTKTAGVETYDDWDGFGQRLTGSGTTVFTDAEVDPANVSEFADRFPYQTALYQHILLVALAGIAQAVTATRRWSGTTRRSCRWWARSAPRPTPPGQPP